MWEYFYIIIFLFFSVVLIQAVTLACLRSRTPNFCKAAISFPLVQKIDKQDCNARKYKICLIQDKPSRLALKYEFYTTEKGVVIREFVIGIVKRNSIFVPWHCISELLPERIPWYIDWWFASQENCVVFQIKETPITCYVKRKDWEKPLITV